MEIYRLLSIVNVGRIDQVSRKVHKTVASALEMQTIALELLDHNGFEAIEFRGAASIERADNGAVSALFMCLNGKCVHLIAGGHFFQPNECNDEVLLAANFFTIIGGDERVTIEFIDLDHWASVFRLFVARGVTAGVFA